MLYFSTIINPFILIHANYSVVVFFSSTTIQFSPRKVLRKKIYIKNELQTDNDLNFLQNYQAKKEIYHATTIHFLLK